MKTFTRFLKFIRPARWPASFGTSISFGIIAFGGVGTLAGKTLLFGLTITAGSLPIVATAVFFLAVSIESAIFKTSIYEASNRDENAIKRSIAKRELKKLIENDQLNGDSFLITYKSKLQYLRQLENDKKKYYDDDIETAKYKTLITKQEIEELQRLFFKSLSSKISDQHISADEKIIADSLSVLLNKANLLNNVINAELDRKKTYITYISIPLAIFTGICAGLFTIGAILASWPAIQACLLTLTGISLGSTAPFLLTTMACIFSSKGYCMMMYNTLTEMIQNDTLFRWGEEVIEFFKAPKDSLDALQKGIKVIGILALTTLMVLATFATAGTWWHLANIAVKAAPVVFTSVLTVMRIITGLAMIIPTFLFNIINGLETSKKLYNKIFSDKKRLPVAITPTEQDQNSFNYWNLLNPFFYLQLCNPCALLFKTFRTNMYVGHVISSGFTAVESDILSPSTGAFFQTATEFLTDAPFIHHKERSDNHDGFLLNEIEALFGWASIVWDYVFGNCRTFGNQSWRASQEKFYPSAKLPAAPRHVTETLGRHLAAKIVENQITELTEKKDSLFNTPCNKTMLCKKINSFGNIRNKLQEAGNNEKESTEQKLWKGIEPSIIQAEINTLSIHRNPASNLYSKFSSKSPKPESVQLLDRMKTATIHYP